MAKNNPNREEILQREEAKMMKSVESFLMGIGWFLLLGGIITIWVLLDLGNPLPQITYYSPIVPILGLAFILAALGIAAKKDIKSGRWAKPDEPVGPLSRWLMKIWGDKNV